MNDTTYQFPKATILNLTVNDDALQPPSVFHVCVFNQCLNCLECFNRVVAYRRQLAARSFLWRLIPIGLFQMVTIKLQQMPKRRHAGDCVLSNFDERDWQTRAHGAEFALDHLVVMPLLLSDLLSQEMDSDSGRSQRE